VIPFARDLDDGTLVASLSQPELTLVLTLAAQVADMLDDLARAPSIADPDAAALYESVGIGGSAAIHSDPAIARLLPMPTAAMPTRAATFAASPSAHLPHARSRTRAPSLRVSR